MKSIKDTLDFLNVDLEKTFSNDVVEKINLIDTVSKLSEKEIALLNLLKTKPLLITEINTEFSDEIKSLENHKYIFPFVVGDVWSNYAVTNIGGWALLVLDFLNS